MVAKKFVPSLESLSSLGFEERNLGCPRNFARMSRTPGGVQKVGQKKVRAHFSFPTHSRCRYREIYYCHQNRYRAQKLFLGINSVILSPPDYRKRNPTGINLVIWAQGDAFCRDLFWIKPGKNYSRNWCEN